MSNFTKTISQDDEDEQHSFSHRSHTSISNRKSFYSGQLSRKNKKEDVWNNVCVTVLSLLLLISISVLTYRYVELTQREKENRFTKADIQTNIQTGDASQQVDDHAFQTQSTLSNPQQNEQKIENQEVERTTEDKEAKLESTESLQDIVQEPSQQNQNPLQPKTTQGQGVKNQQQQILGEGTLGPQEESSEPNIQGDEHSGEQSDEKVDEKSDEQETQTQTDIRSETDLTNANSVEEAQLLHEKNEEIKLQELKTIKSELQMHTKVKQSYQQLFTTDESRNQQEKSQASVNSQQKSEQNSKETLHDSQKMSENKKQESQYSQQKKQQPKQSAKKEKPKAISSQHITDKDLYDPIIRVKSQIQKNLNSKFDDLYYIKAGTNITEAQYKAAIQRMHLWKFFNPLTKKLQILDDKDVTYEDLDLSTPQSTQAVLQKMQRLKLEQKLQYEQKYQVSQYGQIPFCIIIPSYKNQDKYFRNLNSILQQDYENYHIIYIDDASHDGTAQKVRSYIEKYQVPESRLLFIENQVNKKALPNIDYAARRLCNSGEIMAIIDGDDYLIGTQSFKIINARYQSQNLLVLYTNHLRVHEPIYLKVGTCIDYPEKIKKTRSFRRFSIFPASHLRTFFVDLYWRISIRDLKDYQGGYFTAANDFAIMMPVLQMAGDRYEYFSELTYVYDAGTGFNNFQTKADKQAKNFKITKRRHKYPKLEHDLEFEKNLIAKGLMKPLVQNNTPPRPHPSSASRLRRNINKL